MRVVFLLHTNRHLTYKLKKSINCNSEFFVLRRSMMGILVEEQWETTLFYLATLSTVFILGCILRFLIA